MTVKQPAFAGLGSKQMLVWNLSTCKTHQQESMSRISSGIEDSDEDTAFLLVQKSVMFAVNEVVKIWLSQTKHSLTTGGNYCSFCRREEPWQKAQQLLFFFTLIKSTQTSLKISIKQKCIFLLNVLQYY